MAKIAVMGYGTVGSGVVEVLRENGDLIAERCGQTIEVKKVLDLRDFPGDPVQEIVVHDINEIVNDDEISVVCETMGGVGIATKFVSMCLEAGKSVVTSNKAMVAANGTKLLQLAQKNNVRFLFEASVGGGIPIIRNLRTCLTADHIQKIFGIVNGTTNYMLTKMYDEGADYAAVLKEAQDKGFAEADPSADVEGWDACRKLAILSSIVSGKFVNFENIHTEGITKVTPEDMAYAKEMGCMIRLVGQSVIQEDQVHAMVAPMMFDQEHALSGVNMEFNAIFLTSDMLGDTMFYGQGAGKLPTASAVVSDVIEAVVSPGAVKRSVWTQEEMPVADFGAENRRFFARVSGDEALADELGTVLGSLKVLRAPRIAGEFGIVTGKLAEETMAACVANHPEIISVIRMAD